MEVENHLQQTQQFQQQQILQEIQYFVYQDLANILGVLTDYAQSAKYLKDPSHPYLHVALNRLILQSNLSNAVHFDCTHQYNQNGLKEQYEKEKQNALSIFNQQLLFTGITEIQNAKVSDCINLYQKSLKEQTQLIQLTPEKSQIQSQFNEDVLGKIVGGIREKDNIFEQIRKGEYKAIFSDDISALIISRKENALQKLSANFPKACCVQTPIEQIENKVEKLQEEVQCDQKKEINVEENNQIQ